MPVKNIKLGKKDDIASVVKQIKDLHEREVVFELEKGSLLLRSSDNLRLMKRTGEVLGKKILVVTDDDIGKILAKKAGVLAGGIEVKMPKGNPRVARSDVKPRFSDILGPRRVVAKVVTHAQQKAEAYLPKLSFKFPNYSKLIIGGLAVLVIAFLALAILLPRADITVFARSEPITRDFEITVDRSINQAEPDKLLIPGVSKTSEVSQTKNFKATGANQTGVKATGTVVIYNFTNNTLTLKAGTTTLIAGGKKYLFTKDATGLKPTGDTPSAPIPVVAEQPGESYNLPINTKFQIVNAALGNREVYAMNPQAISGGSTKPGITVSSEDLNNAVQSLTDSIIAQVAADLSQEKGTPMLLVPTGVEKQILAQTANKEIGEEADSFDMTVIAKITALAFSQQDVTQAVVNKINQVLSSDKYLLDNAQKQLVMSFKTIDLSQGFGVLNVHFETIAAYKVDADSIAKILAGKNENEIKEILSSKPEIDQVEVKFWPSWFVHKAPRLSGKIYIKTVLSQE